MNYRSFRPITMHLQRTISRIKLVVVICLGSLSCMAQFQLQVSQYPTPSNCDGLLEVVMDDFASGPFIYTWGDNPSNVAARTNVCEGTYAVTVTDGNACTWELMIDLGVCDSIICYKDADGDGYGDITQLMIACDCPPTYVSEGGDCDDSDNMINPGVTEECDGIDNNCDGRIDEGQSGDIYYADLDGDGHGDATNIHRLCTPQPGFVLTDDDCNDNDNTIYPGAPEICDNLDNDCDGEIDEGLDCINFTTAPQDLVISCPIEDFGVLIQDWLGNNANAVAASDCGPIISITNDYESVGPALPCSGPLTVTFKATDICGYEEIGSASISFSGFQPVTITQGAQDMEGDCDENGLQDWLNNYGGLQVSSGCGPLTWTRTALSISRTCDDNDIPSRNYRYRFRVTDVCGNQASSIATFRKKYQSDIITMVSSASSLTVDPCSNPNPTVAISNWLDDHGGLQVTSTACSQDIAYYYTHDYDGSLDDACGIRDVTFSVRGCDDDEAAPWISQTVQLNVGSGHSISIAGGASRLDVEPCMEDQKSKIDAWLSNLGGATIGGNPCGNIMIERLYDDDDDIKNDGPYLEDDYCRFSLFKVVDITFRVTDECQNVASITKQIRFDCGQVGGGLTVAQDCDELTASLNGGSNIVDFQWYQNSSKITGETNSVFSFESTGSYRVYASTYPSAYPNHGCELRSPLSVYTHPCDNANVDISQSGSQIFANVGPTCLPIEEYIWTRPNGSTITTTSNTIDLTIEGLYEVEVVFDVAGGCSTFDIFDWDEPNIFQCEESISFTYPPPNGNGHLDYNLEITSDICLGINYDTYSIPDNIEITYANNTIISVDSISTDASPSYPGSRPGFDTIINIDFVPGYNIVNITTGTDYGSTGYILQIQCGTPGNCNVPSDAGPSIDIYEEIANGHVSKQSDDRNLLLYPVPANNQLTLEWESETNAETTIMFYDIVGKSIHTTKWSVSPGFNKTAINTTEWISGTYFMSIRDNSGILHYRKVEIVK